jgi:VWFA-related protein
MKPIGGVVAAIILVSLGTPGSARQGAPEPVRAPGALAAPGRFPAAGRQAAQQQPAPRYRTGVDLVAVDVSVLDHDRRPVHGLTIDDFTILENGKPQSIAAFTAIDIPEIPEGPVSAPWIRDVAPDVRRNTDFNDQRVVVIAMDDATPMPAVDVLHAKDLARRTIDGLGPGDVAAVVYALNKSAGQEFTQDRSRLLAAVDRFNGSADLAAFDGFDRGNLTLYLAATGTLKNVAEYLVDLPDRRKALIWVSVGVPVDIEMAQGGMISLEDPGSATTSGVVHDVIRSMRDLLAAAQRANVNVYALDPGGLRAPAPQYSALTGTTTSPVNPGRLNRDFLQAISTNTGGFAVIDTNDPDPGIRQIYRENGSYYLLGYARPDPRAQGSFRRIEVRVNRPDVTVRARNGYYEPLPPGRRNASAVSSAVDTALAGVIPKSDLEMMVTAAPFAVPGRRQAAVAVVLGVHQAAPARASRIVQQIDLRVSAFSPDGRQRGSRRDTIPVTLNVPGMGGAVGYELLSRLDLEPGRYHLRVAATSSLHGVQLAPRAPAVALLATGQNTGSRSGSIYYDFDVPDFANAPLSLSGVVLGVTPPVVSGPKDRLAPLVPLVPTTMREFARNDQVTGFLRVYQGGTGALAPVTLSIQIVNGQNAAVVKTSETLGAERFAKGRAADYFVEVPIARLSRGPHLLTVEANTGGKTARRDVRFEVR